jgi:transcriptional regulator with XRE-family HTH domain
MSKNFLGGWTSHERAELASQVKTLRVSHGMTQAQLAEAAGVTRQTISNIEGGSVPQEGSLRKVLDVLGVTPGGSEFSKDTDMWLGLIGGVLEQMPEPNRARAGQAALHAATAELVSLSAPAPTVEDLSDIATVHPIRKETPQDDRLAAKRGRRKADEPHAE